MNSKFIFFLLLPLLVLTWFFRANATVEWDVVKTLKMEGTPLDVAVSQNGRWIFVLTDKQTILVYSPDGTLKDKVTLGHQVDKINVGPREGQLYLTSHKDKTLEILNLDFIQDIQVSGSPFKGPKDAPVVVAVFTDFQ